MTDIPLPGHHHAVDRRNGDSVVVRGFTGPASAAQNPRRVALLAFFGFPTEHWIHLRTTNPIESTFATVRLRTKVTKAAGSRAAGLASAFKLIKSAQARWRAANAPRLIALVRAGAHFERGILIERSETRAT